MYCRHRATRVHNVCSALCTAQKEARKRVFFIIKFAKFSTGWSVGTVCILFKMKLSEMQSRGGDNDGHQPGPTIGAKKKTKNSEARSHGLSTNNCASNKHAKAPNKLPTSRLSPNPSNNKNGLAATITGQGHHSQSCRNNTIHGHSHDHEPGHCYGRVAINIRP